MARKTLGRRGFLKGTALGGSVALVSPIAGAREYSGGGIPWEPSEALPPKPAALGRDRFFTPEERAFVKAAVDRLIPPDEWPGASDLGVVEFLDNQLAGQFGRAQRWYMQGPWQSGAETQGYQSRFAPAGLFRTAIRAIDAYCARNFANQVFARLNPAQQDTVLRGLDESGIELEGVSGKTFFDLLLHTTIEGYFGDPVHGGNRDMIAWRMIGFPGARYDYRPFVARHNQRLDLEPVSVAGMTPASIGLREG